MSIYRCVNNQKFVLDELEPKLISFVNKIQDNNSNVTFTNCNNPNEMLDDTNKFMVGLYFNLKIYSPICGPMVLWFIIHIHLGLHIKDESHYLGWMEIWGSTCYKNIRLSVVQNIFFI